MMRMFIIVVIADTCLLIDRMKKRKREYNLKKR